MCELFLFELYMLIYSVRLDSKRHNGKGKTDLHLLYRVELATVTRLEEITTAGEAHLDVRVCTPAEMAPSAYELRVYWIPPTLLGAVFTIQIDDREKFKRWEVILENAIGRSAECVQYDRS